MNNFIYLLGAFCASLFLISCEAGSKKDTYKIGAIIATTGPASWLGEPEKKTLILMQEKINDEGGLEGKKIEIIIEDSEGSPEKAVNAFKKLVLKHQVLAVIGPTRSGSAIAVASWAEKKEVPLLTLAASDSIVTESSGKIRKWVFSVAQKNSLAVERIFQECKEKKIKTIAVLSGATGFGDDGRKWIKQLAPKYGVQVVAEEIYQPSDVDMTPQLLRIKKMNPQALINWSIVPAQVIVPRNLKQLGYDVLLFQSHGFGHIEYLKGAGGAAEQIIFPSGRLLVAEQLKDGHEQKEKLLEYLNLYEKKFNEPVSTFGGHAFDAFNFVLSALKAGSHSRDSIRNHIEKQDSFIGTGGVFQFSHTDHNGLTIDAFALIRVVDDHFSLYKN